ncbi:MAG: ABC transporter ATP-binding protein [Lachnospiraceae bacterium]
MNSNILSVRGLTKRYQDFTLNNVSFSVPYGSIVGLIGENGAGKSTIIKMITNVIKSDSGNVAMFKNEGVVPVEEKSKLAVVFDGSNFPDVLNVQTLNNVLKNIYPNWNEEKYFSMISKLDLPKGKKIKDFSKGMKMKLSIIVAFSHNANLMILDEATSGLDPVVRDDILDMLLDFVQDETNSVLMSSHITGDLEKIADYIIFIHKGKLLFNLPKDELMYSYGILKCGEEEFHKLDKEDIVAYRKQDYSFDVLISDRQGLTKKYPKANIETATIDEIMVLYIKGERK